MGGQRARPPRRPLDEAQIVDAALQLVREVGVDGLSVRLLTTRLGVALGATYRHVGSKQELLEACARRIHAEVDRPRDPDEDPTTWVLDLMVRLTDVLGSYPGMAPWVVLHGRAEFLGWAPSVTAALLESGLDRHEATRAMHVLSFYLAGVLLADYRGTLAAVGVFDYAEELRADLQHVLGPSRKQGRKKGK